MRITRVRVLNVKCKNRADHHKEFMLIRILFHWHSLHYDELWISDYNGTTPSPLLPPPARNLDLPEHKLCTKDARENKGNIIKYEMEKKVV